MIPELSPYSSSEHKSFTLGDSSHRALLIHGFPGTPAEVRPLADVLHQLGWQVHAPLLPGFGADIINLNQRHREDWTNAVLSEWLELQSGCEACLLLGYSMGGAVALHVAAESKPDKLVLISPFWRAPGLYQWLVPLVRRLAPNFRPFKKADFSDPRLRQFFSAILPDAELDDPQVQDYIRSQFILPLAAMEEVIRLGKEAYHRANQIQAETLIMQGSEDPVVQPGDTRRLAERLGGNHTCYHEIQAAHDLLAAGSPQFNQLANRVSEFAGAGCAPFAVHAANRYQYHPEILSR